MQEKVEWDIPSLVGIREGPRVVIWLIQHLRWVCTIHDLILQINEFL